MLVLRKHFPFDFGTASLTLPNKKRRYEPVSGADFFDEALNVSSSDDDAAPAFRVYYTAPGQPSDHDQKSTVMVFCHGAGFSGLSFAQTVKAMRSLPGTKDLGFAAIDARGHGEFLALSFDLRCIH